MKNVMVPVTAILSVSEHLDHSPSSPEYYVQMYGVTMVEAQHYLMSRGRVRGGPGIVKVRAIPLMVRATLR